MKHNWWIIAIIQLEFFPYSNYNNKKPIKFDQDTCRHVQKSFFAEITQYKAIWHLFHGFLRSLQNERCSVLNFLYVFLFLRLLRALAGVRWKWIKWVGLRFKSLIFVKLSLFFVDFFFRIFVCFTKFVSFSIFPVYKWSAQ